MRSISIRAALISAAALVVIGGCGATPRSACQSANESCYDGLALALGYHLVITTEWSVDLEGRVNEPGQQPYRAVVTCEGVACRVEEDPQPPTGSRTFTVTPLGPGQFTVAATLTDDASGEAHRFAHGPFRVAAVERLAAECWVRAEYPTDPARPYDLMSTAWARCAEAASLAAPPGAEFVVAFGFVATGGGEPLVFWPDVIDAGADAADLHACRLVTSADTSALTPPVTRPAVTCSFQRDGLDPVSLAVRFDEWQVSGAL
ncbi:MAG TPA: hypothetical protein VGQ83_07300 [Polyangia bacterium]|jgi:hypothetical protein